MPFAMFPVVLVRLAALFVLLVAVLPSADTADSGAPIQARQVAQNVWMVQGEIAMGSSANRNVISNAGFVITGDGVLVVDALGSPTLARELIAETRRITPQPIRYLVVTHYHADHIYGLQAFKDAGVTILAHPGGREYLTSETAKLRLQASREELAP